MSNVVDFALYHHPPMTEDEMLDAIRALRARGFIAPQLDSDTDPVRWQITSAGQRVLEILAESDEVTS